MSGDKWEEWYKNQRRATEMLTTECVRLDAHNKKLREALEDVLTVFDTGEPTRWAEVAREALKEKR